MSNILALAGLLTAIAVFILRFDCLHEKYGFGQELSHGHLESLADECAAPALCRGFFLFQGDLLWWRHDE